MIAPAAQGPRLNALRLPVYTHERGNFAALRNARVLVYFPHGLGDWVQFAVVLPWLEPSNRYWMTRYGDDCLALLDGCVLAAPAYLGFNGTQNGDGARFGNRHFGLDYASIDGDERELLVPDSLFALCQREGIDAVLWTSYPEVGGRIAYPYHSKARHVLRSLVSQERCASGDLGAPLSSALTFAVEPFVRQWVEARLMNLLGLRGRKLCLVARNGYTSVGKNRGHAFRDDLPPHKRREGEECRDFMRLLRAKDDRWIFLVAEDRFFAGDDTVCSPELHAHSYAEVFGPLDQPMIPFGLVMKVLVSLADLCVGVPVGPFHLCMAKAELPTVGLWIEHVPSWYEEPKAASVHVIGRHVRERGLDRRPGSFSTQGRLQFRTMHVETRPITGEQVLAATELLLT